MNNLNKFAFNPVNLDISRSRFPKPYDHKTTLESGALVPFYVDEVMAGDTFEMNFKSLTRMLTPVVPTMDNLFQDIWFFFVPYRLCTLHDKDWQKIAGENFSGYWTPQNESTLESTGNSKPFFDMFTTYGDNDDKFDIEPQSLASYLGLPIGTYTLSEDDDPEASTFINTMPFVAYAKIWNEYFRDENTQTPIEDFNTFIGYSHISFSSSHYDGTNSSLQRVNKIHDLFTDCLPSPQKGPDVGVVLGGLVPVITSSVRNVKVASTQVPMSFKSVRADNSAEDITINRMVATDYGTETASKGRLRMTKTEVANTSFETSKGLVPDNLYVNIDNTVANVNGMRIAFAYQRFLEKNARGGTRYREYIKSQFGVSVQEGFVQVPEYLGGHRFPLMISQVLQTFETSNSGPLGSTGAWSNTYNEFKAFTKSFSEHGFVIGLTAIRPMQSYSQMLPKMFSRNRIIDWYHPTFANIGEQALLNRELNMTDSDGYNMNVFGYQEAWYAERYKPNYVSGYLAPQAGSNAFRPWTYCNYFLQAPALNSSFKVQTSTQVANTLVDSNEPAQFILEAFCDLMCTRPMPLFSIPGLIDHH